MVYETDERAKMIVNKGKDARTRAVFAVAALGLDSGGSSAATGVTTPEPDRDRRVE